MSGTWRLRGPFGVLLLGRPGDLPPGSDRPLPAASVRAILRRAADDPRGRRELQSLHDALLGRPSSSGISIEERSNRAFVDDFQRIAARIERAIRAGKLAIHEQRASTRGLPAARTLVEMSERLGLEADGFLNLLLFDASGQPIPNAHEPAVRYTVILPTMPGGERSVLVSNGRGFLGGIAPGGPSTCTVTCRGLLDGTVPPSAGVSGPPKLEQIVALSQGPVLATRLVTRRGLSQAAQSAVLDATNVFQLRRRSAEIVELEHFHDDGAVLLPGRAPDAVYRDGTGVPLNGIDALAACLRTAQAYAIEHIRVTGHHTLLAQQRADGIAALLVADESARAASVDLFTSFGSTRDLQRILEWAASRFAPGSQPAAEPPSVAPWSCDPFARVPPAAFGTYDDATRDAVAAFQESYATDAQAGLFARRNSNLPLSDDAGNVGPETIGAIFDCYVRALRPVVSPSPMMPQYPLGGPETYTGANADRPVFVSPFVVLGTNGPGNAPITIAKYGSPTGNEADYLTGMVPINPQYRFGVDPEFVGQALNVPEEWAPRLVNHGYTVMQDQRPGSGAAQTSGPPALASKPLAVGCGAHHVVTPFADAAARRGKRRAVEVVLLDAADAACVVACGPGDGACAASQCELYDPREHDLRYVPLGSILATVRVHDASTGAPLPGSLVTLSGPASATPQVTDDTGLAVFSRLLPGIYRVRVENADFGSNDATLVVQAPGGSQIDFSIPGDADGEGAPDQPNQVDVPLGQVNIVVLVTDPSADEAHAGLGFSTVRLDGRADGGGAPVHRVATADERGVARFAVPRGVYVLEAVERGFVPSSEEITVGDGRAQTFRILLRRPPVPQPATITALTRVTRSGEPDSVRVCAPLRVQATTINASGADLSSIIWTVRVDGIVVSDASLIRTKDDKLKVPRLPDEWFGKRLEIAAGLPGQGPVAFNPDGPGEVPDQSEVAEYIALVRKVEAANPTWDAERVLTALRHVAGVASPLFQYAIYDTKPPSGPTDHLSSSLSPTELTRLHALSAHKVESGVEKGIAHDDMLGFSVALGHVIAGMAAGMHRQTTLAVVPLMRVLGIAALGVVPATLDNLYLVTIGGDLGQATVEHKTFGTPDLLGTLGSEATDAELTGDIDGFLIGSVIASGITSVSDTLQDYYCVRGNDHGGTLASERFRNFAPFVDAMLDSQTLNFARFYFADQMPEIETRLLGRGIADAQSFFPDASDSAKTVSTFSFWQLQMEAVEKRNAANAREADTQDASFGWP